LSVKQFNDHEKIKSFPTMDILTGQCWADCYLKWHQT